MATSAASGGRTRFSWQLTEAQRVIHAGREEVDEPPDERAREKRSITLPADVAAAVDEHVKRGAAPSFSAALSEAAARWAANQDLRAVLDELYAADPEARPTDDEVAAAAARLGLA